ncbi:MAG: phage portal protein [Bacteroidota bacterium]
MLNALLTRIGLKKRNSQAVGLASQVQYPWFGLLSRSGTKVSLENIEGLSAVGRANNIICNTIASLPLEVFEQEENGDIRLANEHPVHSLVNNSPNKFLTSFTWLNTGQMHVNYHGNHYCYIQRNGNNRPIALRMVDPRGCYPQIRGDELYYIIAGVKDAIPARDMIHIVGDGFDGLCGKGIIRAYRDSLGVAIAMRDFDGEFYSNGAHLDGVVTTTKDLSIEARRRLSNYWKDTYSGLDNAGATAFLDEGMSYQSIGLNHKDTQFVEKQNLMVQDIARIFGTPEYMLQQGNKVYTNIEQVYLEFVRGTMRQWIKRWEQELNRKLFYASEQGRYFVRFNMNSLLRGDSKSRAEFYEKLFKVGALSPNDIRRLENMNPVEDGDRYFVQTNNFTPLELVDEVVKNRNQKTTNQTKEDE